MVLAEEKRSESKKVWSVEGRCGRERGKGRKQKFLELKKAPNRPLPTFTVGKQESRKRHRLGSENIRFSHLFEQIVVVDAYSSLRERRYSCLRCSIVTQFQEAHFLAATFLEIHHRSTAL